MPTSLTVTRLRLPVVPVGPTSALPLLHGTNVTPDQAGADDSLRQNLRFGQPRTLLPYHAQDGYAREPAERDLLVAVLANEHLTATFLLELGGRLWSLVDHRTGRELLYQPDVVQLGNLALRNAWFAGGVEWNLGTTGHWPLTCSPVHAGRITAPSGFPVLRMWEFERMRRLVWRIDCWLPSGSPVLYVKPYLRNPYPEPVPLYWWSNIAVPESAGLRVVAPASRATHFGYVGTARDVPVPQDGTNDISYPARLDGAADYFFDIEHGTPPWIAAVDSTGAGLGHMSTPPLRGRKLFVWGRGRGGGNWQRWLGGSRRYVEIQAGLARTQLEHVPLAGGAAATWTEVFAPLNLAPSAAAADWSKLGRDVERSLDSLAPEALRAMHAEAEGWAARSPDEILSSGSGWGALEVELSALPEDGATPFAADTIEDDQAPWLHLARTGVLPESEPPAASVLGPRWAALLAAAPTDWHKLLHLGRLRLADGDRRGARQVWHASLALRRTAWAERDLAALAASDGYHLEAADRLTAAHALAPGSLDITLETLGALCSAGRFAQVLALVAALPREHRENGRVRFYECRAAVECGDLARAGRLLDDGLVLADLREGEHGLTELWARYQLRSGTSEPLPERYDFRMHVEPQPTTATNDGSPR